MASEAFTKGITVGKGHVVISANQIYKYKKNQR